jgi:hypothetical protein
VSDSPTPFQADRDRAEQTGKHPESWGPYHRHFGSDAVHRDGGAECDQPGTPRRVYVFDPDALDEHEAIVARWAVNQYRAEQEKLADIEDPDSAGKEIAPEFRARLTAAAGRALRVRREVLLLAGHASRHLPGPRRLCRACWKPWPCPDVHMAAGPVLDAIADTGETG